MYSFRCHLEMPGNLLAFKFLNNLSLFLLEIGCMLEFECFINYIVLGVVQELEHFELMFK
jgi:hypothetical protein